MLLVYCSTMHCTFCCMFPFIKILLFSQSRLDACAIMLLFFNWEQWSKWHCVFLMLCNGAMDQCHISKAITQFVKFNIINTKSLFGNYFLDTKTRLTIFDRNSFLKACSENMAFSDNIF